MEVQNHESCSKSLTWSPVASTQGRITNNALVDLLGSSDSTWQVVLCSGWFEILCISSENQSLSCLRRVACNGCKIRRLTFDSSPMIESSRHTIVSLALQVAFYASGCTYAQYYRILKQSLGVQAVTCKPFYEMIKLVLPHVSDMIDEMCTEAMDDMEALLPGEIGSMQRLL